MVISPSFRYDCFNHLLKEFEATLERVLVLLEHLCLAFVGDRDGCGILHPGLPVRLHWQGTILDDHFGLTCLTEMDGLR